MKFVHLADVHLDMPFTSLRNNKELAKRRRLEQKFIFRKVIDLIKELNNIKNTEDTDKTNKSNKDNKIQALFIAGDLFEHKFVQDDTINYIISCFKEISDVKIYITPGNHDPLIKSSPYNTFEWPENVFIFGGEVGMDTFDDINIYGLGFDNFEMDSEAVKDIEIEEDKINILVTHANLDGAEHRYHDVKSQWLNKFDYVALGHIHLPKVDDSKIIYPGSLVAGGFDETGEHGLVIGEITKEKLKIEFVKMDDTEFEIKTIDISNCMSPNEVLDKLKLKNNIYKIILTGIRNIDINTLKEMITVSNKNVCEIEDKTRLDYNLEKIATQKTLKGMFTKKMLEELKKNPEEEEKIMQAIEYVYNNM